MSARIRRLAWFGLVFTAALAAAVTAFAGLSLRLALSDSSTPAGIYRLRPLAGAPARGELVGACLPQAIAEMALRRGYIEASPWSACPAHAAPVGKLALGLPGDTVEVEPGFVAINGRRYAASATAARDSGGRALAHVAWGVHRVRPGEVWLFGFHNARSWDARYFGPVPLAAVKWAAAPVLTLGAER